jgi:COMPASS component BRE2
VALSWVDRSAFLRVSPDALTATTDRGYRSARATVSVRSGTWYYEAVIVRGDGSTGSGKATGADGVGNPHVRVGWGRREAGLDAPVGADAYAYGLRDVGGEKVHISRARPYGRSFGTGDVVGCLITLPERPAPTSEEDPAYVRRWRIPLRYKGQLYFEMDEYPAAKEMEALVNREGRPAPSAPAAAVADDEPKKKKKAPPGTGAAPAVEAPTARPLPTLPGSSISFFLNGEPLGEAFSDIYDVLPLPAVAGEKKKKTGAAGAYERERESYQHHDDGTLGYFPMVSCFGRGKVRMNFGPDWMCPPSGLEAPPRPLCDRWAEARAEEVVYDERDEVALAEKLRRDMAAAAEAKADAVAAAASGAVLPQSKRSRDKKRKKGTPAPGEIATPGDGTPRDSGTPFEPTPASSPARARTDHTPFDDTATAASTPYDSPMAVDTEDHVKEEPRVGVGMGTGMEVDADGEAEDADPDPDADGEEDANEGVSWA